MEILIKCPKCESLDVWKYGKNIKDKQKYQCKKCFHVFTEGE